MTTSPSSRWIKSRSLSSTLIALGVAIALLYFGRVFFITFSAAVMAAFILEPFVGLAMRLRLPRAVASFLVCAVAVCALYLLGLGVYAQTSGLVLELPKYQQRINDLTEQVLARIEAAERAVVEVIVPRRLRERQEVAPPEPPKPVVTPRARRKAPESVLPAPNTSPAVQEVRIRPERPPLLDFFYSHLGGLYEWLLMASFVPFLVYFMLSWQDHIHRGFLQLFEDEEGRVVAEKTLDGIGMVVRAFVVGNFVLGLLLAAVTTLIAWLFRLPFPLLIGPVSGIFSLVPYIGLPLAMLPPLFGALGVHSTLAPYFGLLGSIALLHLLAMNLLYPKIVGTRVHLNPLVVTIALMLWSVLWGAAGLILAIPLTAAVKAVCDHVPTLQPYGRILGD